MPRQPLGDVGQPAAPEELVRAALGRVAVGAGVVALAHAPVEGRFPALDGRARGRARGIDGHGHPVRRHLDQQRQVQVRVALQGQRASGGRLSVHPEEVLEAHHAPVLRDDARIPRGHTAHRRLRAPRVTVGARLALRSARIPERLRLLGADDRRVVGRVEVVAEARRAAPRERIAVGVLLGRRRPVQRLQIRDEVDDLLRREDPLRAPRRHDGGRERHARIPELLVQIGVGQTAIAERGEIGADAAGGPDVVARHEVAAGAGRLLPVEE